MIRASIKKAVSFFMSSFCSLIIQPMKYTSDVMASEVCGLMPLSIFSTFFGNDTPLTITLPKFAFGLFVAAIIIVCFGYFNLFLH